MSVKDSRSQLYQKIKEVYHEAKFKNKNDENAFLGLARTYLGLGSNGRPDQNLVKMQKRKEAGDRYLADVVREDQNVSDEAKVKIYKLNETFNIYNKQRERVRQKRVAKTINGQVEELKDTYHPKITEKLKPLAQAYLGRKDDGTKLSKEESNGDGIIRYIGNTLKKPFGKAATLGIGLIAAGSIFAGSLYLSGCGKKPAYEGKIEDILKQDKRKACIQWEKSIREKGILQYELKEDGTFKAKINKELADMMRKNPNVVARVILDNKLYETNKVGPKGEIELKIGTYKPGMQFGIFKKVKGAKIAEPSCGDYQASIREDVKKVKPVIKPEVAIPKPEVSVKPETKEEAKPVIKPELPIIKPEIKVKPEEKKVVEPEKRVEAPPEKKIEVREEIKRPTEIQTSLNKTTMLYREMWGLYGRYDYVTSVKKEEVKNIYSELVKSFKERAPEYMFLDRTPRSSSRGAVPKLVAEFSSYEKEKRLERMLEEEDMNTLKNVTILNFEPNRGANKGYDYLVILNGTPEEKAAQATNRITEELRHMQEKGHFNTYFWERDVKRNNPTAKAPIQGHIFIKNKGFNKVLGAVFTPENTDVELEESDNDNIQIGMPWPKHLDGDGRAGAAEKAGKGKGSISGGPM